MATEIKTTLPTTKTNTMVPIYGAGDDVSLAKYINEIQKFPILTAAQEYEYATKWVKEHDNTAAEKLVASHLRLVVSVAYDFKNYGLPVSDLIASGNMGLQTFKRMCHIRSGYPFSGLFVCNA